MREIELSFVLDDPPRLLSAGDGIQGLLGYSPDELVAGRIALSTLVHPGDSSLLDNILSPTSQETSGSCNLRLRHADGKIRYFGVRYNREPGRDGERGVLRLALQDSDQLRDTTGKIEAANFRAVLEHTRDFLYFKDRNHVITGMSRALVSVTGAESDWTRFEGKTDYDIFSEASADIFHRHDERVFAEGREVHEVQETIAHDGGHYWIDNRKFPVRDEKGEIVGVFGIGERLSDPALAKSDLRETKELLHLFIKHAPAALAMLDTEMRYLAVSRRWIHDFQLDGVDLIGRSLHEVFPVIPAPWREATLRALAGETVRCEEDRWVRADGAEQWLRCELRPWMTYTGAVGGIIVFSEDITQRKKAELALRKSEESLNEAQRIANLGSYVLDHATDTWESSAPLDEVLGIDPDYPRSIAGWCALVHPDDREKTNSGRIATIENRDPSFVREYRIVRPKDGAVRWVSSAGRLEYDEQGGPIKVWGTLQDITDRKAVEAELRESKDLLQLFIEHAPAAIAMFDRNMCYLAASRRWIENYRLQGKEIVGRSAYDVVPNLPEWWKEHHRSALSGEVVREEEALYVRMDGEKLWMRRELRPWIAGNGQIGGIVILSEEITRQKEAEERLRLAATVFTHAGEGITIADPDGTILEVNDAFTRITGYTREEVLGKNPRILQSGLQSKEFYENMWRALIENGHWSGEIWNRTKGGDIYPEKLSITAIRDASGKIAQYVALFSDVTQLKEQEKQLERIAHYDALTGLPNRSLFADRLRQGLAQTHRRSQSLAVACLDLDGFKAINDRYGQEIGDRLLTALAKRIHLSLREGDTLARLGGDEFAAVLLDLQSAEDAEAVLERMLKAASEPVRIGRLKLRVSASIGVAIYPDAENADADQLLRQAGQALYEAKLAGRNRYTVFDSNHDLTLRGHNQELQRIRQALTDREFVLHYQPIVNMRTGTVVGAEALIRWQHPERGLLPPGSFLPIIEQHPLLVEIGAWVIDAALTQLEIWQDAGLDLSVSVNVAAVQLQQMNFPDRLRRQLAAHPGVKPDKLELEVLETSALQDIVQTSSVLDACHALGVSFAIDDFGTGYASLTYLKRLPARTLKIDQSFVRDMLEDPENPTILEGVLGLATAFRRTPVAEGVETVEHGTMLLQLGCEIAQGFGIARPMPAAELPAWIEHWRPDPRWTESPPVHPGNRTLLFACVEHRAWLGAFESYLQGKRHAPPALDPCECRFGAWLEAERQAGRGDQPSFSAIETLHDQLHELAAEILASQAAGHDSNGLERLGMLHGLGDEFLEQLTSLN